MVEHKVLISILSYDRASGTFSWKIPPNCRIKVGAIAGSLGDDGRWHIKVNGKKYLAAKLASKVGNGQNCNLYANNSSGVKGVEVDVRTGKFRASFRYKGRRINLGSFVDFNEAAEIATFTREFFFGEFYADLTK